MEDWLVSMQIQAMAFMVEMEGMKAHNMFTMNTDNYVAYDEKEFQRIADELNSIANTIQEHMRRG